MGWSSESIWLKAYVYSFYCIGHDRVMFGPYWDHIWPYFTSRPARALQFSRLSHHGLRHLSMQWLLFGIMSVQCLNRTGTIFGQSLPLNQLKSHDFQDKSQYALRNMGMGCLFFYNAKEMFESIWDKVWLSIPYSLIYTLSLSLLCFPPIYSRFTVVEL